MNNAQIQFAAVVIFLLLALMIIAIIQNSTYKDPHHKEDNKDPYPFDERDLYNN